MAQIDHEQTLDNPEYRELYRAVVLDPVSDAPRLSLATWLRDHGHPVGEYMLERLSGTVREHMSMFRMSRGYELLEVSGSRDMQSLADYQDLRFTMRMGLYFKVEIDQETFLKYAVELFQNYPITEVVLTYPRGRPTKIEGLAGVLAYGVNDYFSGEWDHWPSLDLRIAQHLAGYDVTRHKLDLESDAWMRGYSDPKRAHRALSDACVWYGRAAAGLPPMRLSKTSIVISNTRHPLGAVDAPPLAVS